MAESKPESNPAKKIALRAALAYAAVAGLWIIVSDKITGLMFSEAQQLQAAQLHKGGLFVAVTALLLYVLIRNLIYRSDAPSRAGLPSTAFPSKSDGMHGWVPFLAFVLLALAIGVIGYHTFDHYRHEIQAERQKTLAAIANLKARQIGDWLAERRGDGELLKRTALFAEVVERWLQGGAKDRTARDKLQELMRAERDFYGYSRLVLFDSTGKDWLTSGEEGETVPEHERIFARQTARSGEIFFSDFHRGVPESGSKIELDMLVPMMIRAGDDQRVVGVLYFRMDPQRQLYPLIQSMPTPSNTGESLLVRGDGDEVVFLNELRHRRDTALNLRLPLSTKDLPAAMAARGEKGMVRGMDYRGVPVLASLQGVAGTPWKLVVKMDEAEIYAPIRGLAVFAIVSTLAFLALAGAMVALWWRQQSAAFAARQHQSELARQKSETDYRVLFDSMLNGFALCEIIVDEAGIPCDFRYMDINPAFERLTGLKRDNVLGRRVREVLPGIEPVWIEIYGRVALNGEDARFQDYVAELGSYFDILAFSPEKGRFAVIFDNVTERKLAEQKIARLTNLYAALSQTNQAIVRIGERATLFREICRVAVELGGFKFAWIGVPEAESGRVRVEASHGDDQGYLADINISLDPNLPQGRGPTGTAIREGRAYIANDYAADPNTAPWHAALFERGIRAAAAFPLMQGEIPVGALTLYAAETDYFDENMVDLLKEMAHDISFALDNFEQKKIRESLERQLFWSGQADHALAEVSDVTLSTDMSVDSVTEIILAWSQALTESAIGFVGYMEQKTGHLVVPAMTGETKDEYRVEDQHLRLERWGGLFDWVIDHRTPLVTNDDAADPRSAATPPGHPPIHRFLCVPALVEGELLGIIALANAAHDYGKQDLLVAERFAAFYAVALNRQRNAEKLQHSLETQRALLDNIPDMAWLKDRESRFIAANEPSAKAYGLTLEEMVGKNDFDFWPREQAERHIADDREVMASGKRKRIEEPLDISNGKRIWIETIKSPIFDSAGLAIGTAGIARDITERKLAQEKLLLDALVFESSSEGMLITDADNRFISVNRAFTEITGYTLEEVLGRNPSMLKSERQDDDFYRNMWDTILKTGHWQGELWNRRKNGEVYPEWLNVTVVRDASGKITHHIGTTTDISSRKLAEDEIYHLTRYDPLTGLPNKFLLEYRLTQAIGRADEARQHIAVVMINLDHFHAVNDSAGYAAGDQVLVKVAQRLSAAVREEDTVARLGADNFVVAELSLGNVNEFISKVEKLLVAIAQPIEVDGREIQLNASMGVSFYPADGSTAMDLIQKAGIAMRHVKSAGGNNYRFFAEEMNAHALAEMALSNDLRHALERNQMVLHYQTQVDTFSGEIVGVEALLRWQHHDRGLLVPKDFIGLAEENGLIVPIGDWVLREACRQAKLWHDAGHSRLSVSVNVSALQFKQGNLAQTAMQAIGASGLEPGFVELELTESMIMSHFEQTQATLKTLKAFGVRFAIDDFGTGYSSLNYLRHFPIDKLKIDISFITDIATTPDNAAIVKAIIAMGHSLELKVIAEGVETEAQAGYLRTIHCDEMQGYYFSHPAPAQEIVALLGAHQPVRTGAEDERVLLLVDDEANVISALKRVLRRDGYRILSADNAQEGLELLAKHRVGVILSDQRMPGMTGIEFLSKVKVMYPDIVRMILSGYTEVDTMTDSINRGAIYKFLTKPWEDEPLRANVKEAFLRYETTRDEKRA